MLVDSNIIIYSTQVEHYDLRVWLKNKSLAISVISKIEVLGYANITQFEIDKSNYYFSLCKTLPLKDDYINTAIQLKQKQKMSLGDAIIAATALENKLTLATANTKDFKHVKGLELINPMIA